MSARTGVRTRPYAPKFADPGTTLTWSRAEQTHTAEVWSAGPVTGSRWAVCDDGSLALLKVGTSGRSAGSVVPLVTRPPGWQARMVRALDRLSRTAALMVSDHEVWTGSAVSGGLVTVPRYHLAECEHAERPATSGETLVWHSDGTVSGHSRATGWHAWLMAHLSAHGGRGVDRLDLCECITGEDAGP